MKPGITFKITLLLFFTLPVLMVTGKVLKGGWTFEKLTPKVQFDLIYEFWFDGQKDHVFVKAFIPEDNDRQEIFNESVRTSKYNYKTVRAKGGRKAYWSATDTKGRQRLTYKFSYHGQSVKYELDESLLVRESFPEEIQPWLQPSEHIQSEDAKIAALAKEILPYTQRLTPKLQAIFDHVHSIPSKPISKLTDALEVLRTNEASCNGKSRLFVALCRQQGIPARLVGGMILKEGRKRTSHQWAEVYIEGNWVPFDALNDHYAFLPGNYMELYRGDEFLIKHTPGIDFDYRFGIKERLSPSAIVETQSESGIFNIFLIREMLEETGMSRGLLRVILLMPLGAVVVALFRNVVGMKTFGVFLPALIAVALHSTGWVFGMISFVIVVLIVGLLHYPLEKWGLLYTPKLVIMLVAVVVTFLMLSILGNYFEIEALSGISFFPIVILTVTAERMARTILEEGIKDASKIMVQTLVVTSFCFIMISSGTMEAVFLSFPELFGIIAGIMLILGRWIGLRLSEYHRFSWIAS